VLICEIWAGVVNPDKLAFGPAGSRNDVSSCGGSWDCEMKNAVGDV